MNTNQIGDLTELKVATSLMSLGYTVSFPYGDNSRYDLIFDNGKLNTVQCKSGLLKDGAIIFATRDSTKRTTRGSKDYEDIDYFGVYCRQNNECYLIPCKDMPKTMATLRVCLSKNNQKKNTRLASKYEISKFASVI